MGYIDVCVCECVCVYVCVCVCECDGLECVVKGLSKYSSFLPSFIVL